VYSRRVEAASVALERGDRLEAERLYSEALAMGEENFGANEPALVVPLNELSRLYVRRSEHARAEPLLNRLLAIRRGSGDQHADVATVLAALAAVRRGLGDDIAAESLYRQALEIREKVHAPNHMSVVVTLEHLADTCAALRNFGEATTLFQRALTTREKVLGANHQTVLALRERLADLAVKAAPTPPVAPRPLPPPPAAPEQLRVSGELVFLYEPEKPKRRASVKRDRVMTPPFSAAVAAASLITSPAHAAPPAREAAPTQTSAPSLPIADLNAFDAVIMPRAAAERVAPPEAPRRSQRISSPVRDESIAPKKKKGGRGYLFAAGGLIVLASAGFFVSSRLPGHSAPEAQAAERTSERPASRSSALAGSAAAVVAAPERLAAQHPDSTRVASVKAMPPAPVSASATSHVAQQSESQGAAHLAAAGLAALPAIGSLDIPDTKAPNADSVLRATTARHDADNEPIVSAGRLRAISLGDDHSEASPVLVGAVPQPRFPDALRAQGVGGEVVVQFLVAADGSVDASTMKVVRSPHELFASAVRNVLPRFHFQPARSAEGKARAETVQYSIQFSATK
jgi:TonB family C-terminal domain